MSLILSCFFFYLYFWGLSLHLPCLSLRVAVSASVSPRLIPSFHCLNLAWPRQFCLSSCLCLERMPWLHHCLRGGSAVGRWTCDLQVAGSIPGRSAFTKHRSNQPCSPPGSLNRVPASARGKGGILTSVGWQVTLCDPIWHVSFP